VGFAKSPASEFQNIIIAMSASSVMFSGGLLSLAVATGSYEKALTASLATVGSLGILVGTKQASKFDYRLTIPLEIDSSLPGVDETK